VLADSGRRTLARHVGLRRIDRPVADRAVHFGHAGAACYRITGDSLAIIHA
jgi:hypothetical protein